MGRWKVCGVLCLLLTVLRSHDGVAAVDCTSPPAPEVVAQAVFEPATAACDLNADGLVSAADMTAATMSPTVRQCPNVGAVLAIMIDNRTGTSPVTVHLSGTRLTEDCVTGSLGTSYDANVQCPGGTGLPCQQITNLAPGMWSHAIRVVDPATGQLQARRSLLVADNAPNVLSFKVFPTVLTVTSTADAREGSLRSALAEAGTLPKPLLIQFADAAFPAGVPTAITLSRALPTLEADDVTIDGIDTSGAIGNRIIDANGLTIPTLAVTGARNHLLGLHLRNAGGNNRDVLSISGPTANGNLIESTVVEQAASADGIGVDDAAGIDFDLSANVIRGCEVSGAADKGIKVTTGAYVRVEHSWVHDNLNGGIQATLGGHVQAFENLVERNRGATAQNGLSANALDDPNRPSGSSELRTRGNIVRTNGANGISVRAFSFAQLEDDYLATNGTSGLRVFNDVGPAASAAVAGVSTVCNGTDGATVADTSVADFGGGPFGSTGNNAFTQNNLPANTNLQNGTTGQISAINNQWEHCGTGASCDAARIAAYDLSDHGLNTVFEPAQAQRAQQPVVTAVSASKGSEGTLLRIFGSGFNVIDGHFSKQDQQCADVSGRNRCVPLRGNCVEIGGRAAAVEAVTPTMLVVRWPFTCLAPTPLIVKTDQGSTVGISNTFTVCTNVSEPN